MPRGLTRNERINKTGLVTKSTVMFRVGRWARNLVANEVKIRKSKGINFLFRKLKNIPSILVSAGPSLDKNVELLKDCYDKACIIVCDAAIGSMLKHDVKPHICFVTDCKPVIRDYILPAYEHSQDIILACDSFVHPSVYEDWKGEVLFYNIIGVPECSLTMASDEFTGSIGRLGAGGGVSTIMLCLASLGLHCSPIVLVGHDFSFTDLGKTHSDNTSTIDNPNDVYKPFMIEDWNDKQCYTNKAYLSFCYWTEDFMLSHPNVYINSTEGGILTNGCSFIPLKDVIETVLTSEYNIVELLMDEQNIIDEAKPENRWVTRDGDNNVPIRQDSTYLPVDVVDKILDSLPAEDLVESLNKKRNNNEL